MPGQVYGYVGPADLLRHNRGPQSDVAAAGLDHTLQSLSDEDGFLTFVVTEGGAFRVGPRRSEHVTLAEGRPVLTAGEIWLVPHDQGWRVAEVTNQSTGYCPDPSSWPALADVLDALGIEHPRWWTTEFTFRRCPACGELNVISDGWMVCRACGADLDP